MIKEILPQCEESPQTILQDDSNRLFKDLKYPEKESLSSRVGEGINGLKVSN